MLNASKRWIEGALLGLALMHAGNAWALPGVPSLNDCSEIIFNGPFQDDSQPSMGSGGAFPGALDATVFVDGTLGNQTYYLYLPSAYQPARAWPLVVLWHGAAGPGQAATQAQAVRSIWQNAAETHGFILLAQAATGASGGWQPPDDQIILNAILNDVRADYNIENTRIYGWGFSAGGHYMHGIWLANADQFAGYAVSAGVLAGFAGTGAPAAALRQLPVYVSIGSLDTTLLPFAQSDRLVFLGAGWLEGFNYWLDVFVGGHQVDLTVPQDSWQRLCHWTVLQ